MKNTVRMLVLAATLAGTFSTTAAAQLDAPAPRSNTAGFHLGVFLNGSTLQVEESASEGGAGGSLHLGYGINPNLSIFARANAAVMESSGVQGESYTLAHFDIGARYSPGTTAAALRPYMQAAVNGRAFSMDLRSQETLEARGPGFSYGFGVEYFYNPSLALEAGLSISVGEFREGRMDGSEWVNLHPNALSARSARLDIGVSWHP